MKIRICSAVIFFSLSLLSLYFATDSRYFTQYFVESVAAYPMTGDYIAQSLDSSSDEGKLKVYFHKGRIYLDEMEKTFSEKERSKRKPFWPFSVLFFILGVGSFFKIQKE
jgi:hypothetical protein